MSKASRRRKQRRNAAIKSRENGVGFLYYEVAVQKVEGGPVYVSTVKENERDKLFPFIARVYEVKSVDDFTFFEVHHIMDNGNVEVLANGGAWPKGAAIISNKGYSVRSKTTEYKAPAPKKQTGPPKIVIGGFVSIPIRKYTLRVL